MTVISFLAFTLLVAAISYAQTRRDRMTSWDAYFLGGRSLSAWVIAGSLMLTNLSTEHLIGLNGDAFNHTIAVMAWETTAAVAMVAAALYFLPRFLRMGLSTIPEYLAARYDRATGVIAAAVFLFSYVLAILPVVLLFGASGIDSLFGLQESFGLSQSQVTWLVVWGVGTLGSLYAIFGGLKAVAISDTINGVGFLIAGLLVPLLALIQVGDGDPLAGLAAVYQAERPKFDITGDEPGSFLPLGVLFTGMMVNQIFFWCAGQQIIQRGLGAKSLKEGQKGILIAAGFKLLGPLVIVLPGVIAYHMFHDTLGPEDYMLAYPTLVKAVLPDWLGGFFAAVMVGAVLSTFNSVLNSSATLFCRDIYGAVLRPGTPPRRLVAAGRACSIALALAAMLIAPMIDTSGSLYNYLQRINATFFGPMLAVILLGMLHPRVSAFSAKASLVGGPALFFLLVVTFNDPVQSFLQWLFGTADEVHFLHFLGLVFVLVVAFMLLASRYRPSRGRYQEPDAARVDMTPWKHAKAMGGFVCFCTLACYVLLAQ
ncbi:MAG: solute:sodium symporter family transporter [Bryobacterales bacterium]|nr:solute:sodium symporter family transporter [Bryobacterales bacterium]